MSIDIQKQSEHSLSESQVKEPLPALKAETRPGRLASSAPRKHGLMKKATIALMAALLVYANQIGSFLAPENRYYFIWRFTDSLALILNVIFLAAAALAISELLRFLE